MIWFIAPVTNLLLEREHLLLMGHLFLFELSCTFGQGTLLNPLLPDDCVHYVPYRFHRKRVCSKKKSNALSFSLNL